MALADLSFKLYENAGLSNLFAGLLSVAHQSDLSDGSQDFVLYFASLAAGRKLQTEVNPGVDDITLTVIDTLPEWQVSVVVAEGYSVEPTAGNNRRYVVTTAGTTAVTEPTWPTAIGSSVTDGTAVWTCIAETHEPTEFKLALTSAGLNTATAGAALALGNSLLSDSGNAVEIHIRVTNAVTTISDNTAIPEIGIYISNVTETVQ